MKAKFIKQHLKELEIEEAEDDWGDTNYKFNGTTYKTKQDAVKAQREKMEQEFRERYIKS